ncbi:MAG: DNA-protecting protein DprA [Caldilineaceae bacterium]|nr:DNA-protecting protein DprA [Caldilineaceae bacterium]
MDKRSYWIAFNKVPGIGPARLSALLETCGDIESAWHASIRQLQAARLDRRTIETLLEARRTIEPERELARAQAAGVHVLTWDDDDYPSALRPVEHAPPVLYLRGKLTSQDEWAVAVVGTRRASTYGKEVAQVLARELARAGVTIVSGLALGIDTVAHRAAVEAGGRTIAVLGSGVDQIYPPQNRGLANTVTQQGALISEYALGTRPEANNFPPRNRIISGLSRGVIIVEAGERSGALITAKFAVEQGRELFAVPGSILHPGSTGCNTLIQQGATPLLSVDEVIEQLNLVRVVEQRDARATVPATAEEAQLLASLSSNPCHVDDLVRSSSMSSAQVMSLLAMLELKGLVRQVAAMTYVRT